MDSLFFRNPRLLALTVALIVVTGLSSLYVSPRLEDPVLTKRFALITTRLPGADAERIESLVTEKLEEELDEIEEIETITSTSRAGVSAISLQLYDWVFEVDEVWSRVRDRVGDVAPSLPAGTIPPQFEELDTRAHAMIAALVWDRPGEPNYAILNRMAKELDDAFRSVEGTELVSFFGAPEEEITVEIRPEALAQLGLTADDVSRQIRASDAKVSAGLFRGEGRNILIEVDTELESIERIRSTPIGFGDQGQFARLGDIADVRRGIVVPQSQYAVIRGRPAVSVSVFVESAKRLDHWAAATAEVLDNFETRLPRGVTLERVFEQSSYVDGRLRSLFGNLLLGAAAVTLVIFVLMGWRSAVVVSSALPLSALMVLGGMRFTGVPLHQMSVTGLIIALGLLIDNAIVMVDEVQTEIRHGLSLVAAIAAAVRKLAVPLFGSTLTTALAFAPIALMPGPGGEFVGAIAITVIIAIFSSLFLAMTVTPALTGLMHRYLPAGESASWLSYGFTHPALVAAYRSTLNTVFRRPLIGMAFGLALPMFGFFVSRYLPEQFFPPADRDQFHIEIELPAHASLDGTRGVALAARELALAHEGVVDVHWFVGESAPPFYYNLVKWRQNTPPYAQALVQLESPDGALELIDALQRELDQAFPEAIVLVRQLEQGPPFPAPVEFRLHGADIDQLRTYSRRARQILAGLPGVIHIRDDLSETLPKLALAVDEEEARLSGLDHESIARQLDRTLEGAVGGSIVEATEELPLRVRVAGADRGDLDEIASLDLLANAPSAQNGRPPIPLSALTSIHLVPEQATISRRDGVRAVTIQGYLSPGILPSTVVEAFQARWNADDFTMPAGYRLELGGEAEARDRAVGNLMSSVSVLLTIMAATLVLSFGSFRIAGIIASVAVLSVGLGTGALWAFGYPFGFMAIVGTMGLIGVAINDAIVVLAAIRADHEARQSDAQAMVRVVIGATRHVIATTLTTIAGFTPLLIAGGSFWRPLATSIAGGVGGATLLALIYVPACYRLVIRPSRIAAPATDVATRPHSESDAASPTSVPAAV